jgi:3-methyladenine DNA glycosylase AlkD
MSAPLDIEAEHADLIAQLRAAATEYRGGDQNDSYTGSGRPFFCVSAPNMRRIARAWLAAHRKAADDDLLAMADRLFAGLHYEEKVLGAVMLQTNARIWRQATPGMADRWLDDLNGWAEVDSLCGGAFWREVMAADWPAWRALIERLAGDPNINKRRAALVLLTAPTRTSDDPRFRELAFEVVERLKRERPILITKAVSWLLRSMAPLHGAAVASYLETNAASLPAIAVRETRVKLATGTKSGGSRRAATASA